ncbi:hypothetical protein [Mucilaginibacter flavus]|uniref:hypothetical protein n=1 Tax=Mucilaginibacter flavus TaxID=931504 RepID=UPI0025B31A82|nr:hypothetical protein [Mucilaginibacter flavus]MDN3584381.1 hypothetical protein [Mucilaginibacter flavus]
MFSFFKRAGNSGAQTPPVNGHHPNLNPALPEVEERVFIETGAPKEHAQEPAQVDHHIGMLYAFMDKNHEVKGYDDALLNPDVSNLNQNLEALQSELVRTINKIKTFYEDFVRETEFHITSRSRSGMVDMVEELEMKKKIAQGHIDKVTAIETDTARGEGDCKGILISYTRGFKNGLAAISHHHILSRRF